MRYKRKNLVLSQHTFRMINFTIRYFFFFVRNKVDFCSMRVKETHFDRSYQTTMFCNLPRIFIQIRLYIERISNKEASRLRLRGRIVKAVSCSAINLSNYWSQAVLTVQRQFIRLAEEVIPIGRWDRGPICQEATRCWRRLKAASTFSKRICAYLHSHI